MLWAVSSESALPLHVNRLNRKDKVLNHDCLSPDIRLDTQLFYSKSRLNQIMQRVNIQLSVLHKQTLHANHWMSPYISASHLMYTMYSGKKNFMLRKLFMNTTWAKRIFIQERLLLDWVGNQPTRCSFMPWSEAVVQMQTQLQQIS